ncbi:sulfite exporter TauE/SafE family protein [Tistrella sp. BH-R2-4]|uniref:Sulfite exporter TauE/SafE family protein n=1 Tax=Tistrella arctica TaxID=3133430 RepID=A0ABU9YD94_9PROT
MAVSELSFAGGFLMGAASSLHCAGMCGGIAAGLMFSFDGEGGTRGRLKALAAAHAGRVVAYATAGLVVGAIGTSVYGGLDRAGAYQIARLLGAATLVWVGLSVAGLVPSLARLDRLAMPLTAGIARVLRPAGIGGAGIAAGPGGAFVSGLAWGCVPCGMVYGALFYAMMTGSPEGGLSVMAGFGLGTVPAVAATALGFAGLRRSAALPGLRKAAGLAIAGLGLLSGLVPSVGAAVLCLP